MGNAYPYVETLKVGIAYAMLLYIWPSIVFRSVLRNRGLTIRFLFCSIVQPVLITTVVLTLGLFHILNPYIVQLLFWGALIASLVKFCRENRQPDGILAGISIEDLITGVQAWKALSSGVAEKLTQWGKKTWRQYRGKWAEYLALTAILLFGMAFFLNGPFHDYSFGCQDQYTHYEWTSALLKGEIFSAGVYPEGMHCFLYAMTTLFGVKLHSSILFLAGIHNSSALLLAAYCLFKELFRTCYTPLFVLIALLTFNGIGAVGLETLSRMSWTLPQEFCQYLVFLCPLLLLRYFRETDQSEKWYRDENLLLLMTGVSFGASTHFYVLIMAFFSCLVVVIVHFKELFSIKRLISLAAASLYGLELGALPMLAACAVGMDLEDSLIWGIHTIFGVSASSIKRANATAVARSVRKNPLQVLYENGYVHLFGERSAILVVLLSLLVLVSVVVCVYAHRRGKLQKVVWPDKMIKGYLSLTALLTVFVFLYAMPYMGLPEVVTAIRTMFIIQIFVFGVVGIPVDLLMQWAEKRRGKALPNHALLLGCLLLYFTAHMTDFRQCTYWWLRRYNAEVVVTDQIMNQHPEGAYKIVSMYEAAYQAGPEHHEELFDFLQNIESGSCSIPSEYIFVYVEKHPLLQRQIHFLTAPHWLAQENYEAYEGLEDQSQCPDIIHSKISYELSQKVTPYYPYMLSNYEDMSMRTILCSKMYRWGEDFTQTHPAEAQVYYEDDDFVCYVIHQKPEAPLELA